MQIDFEMEFQKRMEVIECDSMWLKLKRQTDIIESELRSSFSYHSCVWALKLYVSGGTYSLTSSVNDRFLEKLFMAISFYSQSFCQKSAERKPPKKYFSYFVLGLEPCLFV